MFRPRNSLELGGKKVEDVPVRGRKVSVSQCSHIFTLLLFPSPPCQFCKGGYVKLGAAFPGGAVKACVALLGHVECWTGRFQLRMFHTEIIPFFYHVSLFLLSLCLNILLQILLLLSSHKTFSSSADDVSLVIFYSIKNTIAKIISVSWDFSFFPL